ncbi:hypothetical protein GCM10028824_12820 [Hymenobacter segetis]|uniref:Uncharacterized protein n=1 Tax=Hymenobacter segetis TaxID=2025509 RepID=A0ABU9LVZ9_9BACT
MATTDDKILIYDSHRPALTAGYYKVESTQRFGVDKDSLALPPATLYFSVQGEQYTLNPSQIDSVFPPMSALGDFSTILPNIILERSTFPWERKTNEKDDSVKPWLALMLLTEDEVADASKVRKINAVKAIWETTPFAPVESTNETDISVRGLLIEAAFLTSILPTYQELGYLAHVRGQEKDEKASVVGSRMPVKDKKNIVHLISLEDMYSKKGDFIGKPKDGFYGFASLYSWEFFCNDHFIVTPEVLAIYVSAGGVSTALASALAKIAGLEFFNKSDFLKVIGIAVSDEETASLFKTFEIAHLTSLLKHLNRSPANLRLPDTDDLSLDGYLKLPYVLKTGDRINAVYRGPLVPNPVAGTGQPAAPVPVMGGDELFRFLAYGGEKYVDVSYASAWELGRILALSDKNFSTALFRWKRECYQFKKVSASSRLNGHLILKSVASQYPDMPAFVGQWLTDLTLLKGVPFNYLVPTEAFLPFESLRFFSVDDKWVRCLVDGAFSIGRLSSADAATDAELYGTGVIISDENIPKSGFLLRSRAVDGWPDLVIQAEGQVRRRDELAEDLLFCLYDKQITSLAINQKPESVHFGFIDKDGDASQLQVEYTDTKGKNKLADVNYSSLNKVDIGKIYAGVAAKNVAEFTRALIQKIEEVVFEIS